VTDTEETAALDPLPAPRLELWVTVKLANGTSYEWCHDRMTYHQIAEARRVLGRSPASIEREIGVGQVDLDTVVAVIWMVRRAAGLEESVDDVGAGMTGHDWVGLDREVRPVDPGS
jgi:hypothetical protein